MTKTRSGSFYKPKSPIAANIQHDKHNKAINPRGTQTKVQEKRQARMMQKIKKIQKCLRQKFEIQTRLQNKISNTQEDCHQKLKNIDRIDTNEASPLEYFSTFQKDGLAQPHNDFYSNVGNLKYTNDAILKVDEYLKKVTRLPQNFQSPIQKKPMEAGQHYLKSISQPNQKLQCTHCQGSEFRNLKDLQHHYLMNHQSDNDFTMVDLQSYCTATNFDPSTGQYQELDEKTFYSFTPHDFPELQDKKTITLNCYIAQFLHSILFSMGIQYKEEDKNYFIPALKYIMNIALSRFDYQPLNVDTSKLGTTKALVLHAKSLQHLRREQRILEGDMDETEIFYFENAQWNQYSNLNTTREDAQREHQEQKANAQKYKGKSSLEKVHRQNFTSSSSVIVHYDKDIDDIEREQSSHHDEKQKPIVEDQDMSTLQEQENNERQSFDEGDQFEAEMEKAKLESLETEKKSKDIANIQAMIEKAEMDQAIKNSKNIGKQEKAQIKEQTITVQNLFQISKQTAKQEKERRKKDLEETQQCLRQKNIYGRIQEVEGNGSCLFLSIAYQEFQSRGKGLQGYRKHSQQLRKVVCDWMEDNADDENLQAHLASKKVELNNPNFSLEDYLKQMRKLSEYAHQFEIYILSKIIDRQIIMYEKKKEPVIYGEDLHNPQTPPYFITFHNGNHFNAFIPDNSSFEEFIHSQKQSVQIEQIDDDQDYKTPQEKLHRKKFTANTSPYLKENGQKKLSFSAQQDRLRKETTEAQ